MKFNEFYNNYKSHYKCDNEQYKAIIDKWKSFRNKIIKGELTAIEYNGKTDFFEEGDYSLRQFIEHVCGSDFFGTLGSIVPSELGLWVTEEKDEKIFKYNKKNIIGNEIKQRTDEINTFLKNLITKYTWEELLNFLREDTTFAVINFPSFIFGIVFLNSLLEDSDLTETEIADNKHYDYHFNLVWIYKYDAIETKKEFKSLSRLHDNNNKKLDSFIKSKSLNELCRNKCSISASEMNKDTVLLFEQTVWAFTHETTFTENNIIKIINDKNKQIILTGAPGTGKTFAAKKIASVDENAAVISKETDKDGKQMDIKYQFVQFHPSFDYTDFVEGLRPVNIKGQTTFVRIDGIFKEFCRKAAYDLSKNTNNENYETRYFFIIDEINRADLSKVFGELMYCLEYRGLEGKVKTQYSNLDTYIITPKGPMTFTEIKAFNDKPENATNKIDMDSLGETDVFKDGFYIPENVYIIGTMNDIDRSVESFDFALRRRFKWFEIKAADVMDDVLHVLITNTAAFNAAKERITALNNYISNPEENGVGLSEAYNIGPAYFKSFQTATGTQYKTKLVNIFKNEIESTLKEYVRGREPEIIKDFIETCRTKFGLDKETMKWKD